jgi:hypothetical protein
MIKREKQKKIEKNEPCKYIVAPCRMCPNHLDGKCAMHILQAFGY